MNIFAILIAAVLAAGWYISTNNALVKKRALAEEASSIMDVYLKKRYELVPNLVNTVKGYITYEEETLSKLIELRNQATGKLYDIDLQREISADISKITAFAENYPELKANAQFAILQNQLSETERDIAQARKYYNGAVREYNILVKSFPSKAVASMNGFYELPYYETAEEEKENIKAEF